MGFIWFLIGAILVGSTLWIAYDETIGRRTWKYYAAEWTELEVARLQKAIDEATAKVDKNEVKSIQMEREQVMALLRSGEYK